MKIAIISDIHSNQYALTAVLEDIKKENTEGLIVLGDIFGYYPWACETYELLKSQHIITIIKGNHDLVVLEENEDKEKRPAYYKAARLNRKELQNCSPEAISWLDKLKLNGAIRVGKHNVSLYHGTPEDPANGRYYPDDEKLYDWFPASDQVVLLGHTHYPIFRKTQQNGIIFNPGSVGQPRDGNPLPSWGLWTVEDNLFEIRRTTYDYSSVIKELIAINWDKGATLALSKDYKGNLKL